MKRLIIACAMLVVSTAGPAQGLTPVVQACYPLKNAQGTQGLSVSPNRGDEVVLVSLEGPGCFLSARVSKQGGDSDLTFIELDVDGRSVENISVAAYKNLGLTEDNSYGAMVLAGNGIDVVTFGFSEPLFFRRSLTLRAIVDEGGVVQLLANVIHGK